MCLYDKCIALYSKTKSPPHAAREEAVASHPTDVLKRLLPPTRDYIRPLCFQVEKGNPEMKKRKR